MARGRTVILDCARETHIPSTLQYLGKRAKSDWCNVRVKETDQLIWRRIDGAMACPVEDCGGTPGHYRMLEALSDPNNEEHQEVLEWLGKKYDPNDFAPQKVKFDDRGKRWRTAFPEN